LEQIAQAIPAFRKTDPERLPPREREAKKFTRIYGETIRLATHAVNSILSSTCTVSGNGGGIPAGKRHQKINSISK